MNEACSQAKELKNTVRSGCVNIAKVTSISLQRFVRLSLTPQAVCVHGSFSACLSWAYNANNPFNQGHRELMTHSSYRYGVVKELNVMPSLVIMLIGLTGLETLIAS